MTEKELKKLSRKQLLELLLKQTEIIKDLQNQLDEANEKINNKTILESEAGSIAEAALKLNGIFEAADAAAAQYLENIKRMNAKRSNEESIKEAKQMIEETKRRCAELEAETEKRCKAKLEMLKKK